MKNFSAIERFIRSNFILYRVVRKRAPSICRFFSLEEGFDFLTHVTPRESYVALDIGANDGTSIRMIRRLSPDCEIHSFDPIKLPSFDLPRVFKSSFAISNHLGNVKIYTPVYQNHELTQYSSTIESGIRSQISHDLSIAPDHIQIIESTVPVKTVDSLDLRPFFIKIDVEGAEFQVIEGAIKTISAFLPIILVEIQNPKQYEVISSILAPIGYAPLDLSKSHRDILFSNSYTENYNNYVWLPVNGSNSWSYDL